MSLFGKQLPPKDGISSRNSVGLRLNIFSLALFLFFVLLSYVLQVYSLLRELC